MKAFDRVFIVLFSILLLLAVIISSSFCIAISPGVYKAILIKTNTVGVDRIGNMYVTLRYFGGREDAVADLDHRQTEAVIRHIPQFLLDFAEEDDFSLTLENVRVNGVILPYAEVFGEEAISHMSDVRILFKNLLLADGFMILILILLSVYFVKRRNNVRALLLKYSAATYAGIASVFLLFFAWCGLEWLTKYGAASPVTFYDVLWKKLHYVFFLFDAQGVSGSFFNDSLTSLLNIDFFMSVVGIVVAILVLAIGLTLSGFSYLRFKKK